MADALIIGAGPAGSLAAILLVRRGWNVTLVEQQRFPRDKVCGECISALGRAVLARHRLSDIVAARRPVMLRRGVLVAPSGEQASLNLPVPMWGLSRRALDDALLTEARSAGARICQPARAEKLEGGRVVVRDLRSNQVTSMTADRVLLADGKSTLMGDRPSVTGDFGVKAHFGGVEDRPDAITLFGVAGHYVGLAPIEGERWNIAMSVPEARLQSARGSLDELFVQLKRENAGLAARLRRSERISDWLIAPLPRFAVRRDWPANVIPIGNAAAALEPIGGEGIGLAMRSAELAAMAVVEQRPSADVRRAFSRLWRVRRATCRLIAQLLSRPAIADDIVGFSRGNPELSTRFMGWMGKG